VTVEAHLPAPREAGREAAAAAPLSPVTIAAVEDLVAATTNAPDVLRRVVVRVSVEVVTVDRRPQQTLLAHAEDRKQALRLLPARVGSSH